MVTPSILDAPVYPWADRAAQELHRALMELHPTPAGAMFVAEQAGLATAFVNVQQPLVFIWHDILQVAAQGALTRKLAATVRDLLRDDHPRRRFFDDLLANRPAPADAELRNPDGTAVFDDTVSLPEALLYRDDLTVQIGRVPALIATLQRLAELAPAICRMTVDVHGRGSYGSGMRIGDDLLLTNWHVLFPRPEHVRATAATAEFGYEDDGRGGVLTPTPIACDVATIHADRDDDWAVIRVAQPMLDAWPIVNLAEAVEPVVGEAAYIVQHPAADRKRLGFVRNQVSSFDDQRVHYLTDTQPGSSGSPVFDAAGRLIALHHAGGTPQVVVGRPPLAKNRGIRIPRIVAGLKNAGVTP